MSNCEQEARNGTHERKDNADSAGKETTQESRIESLRGITIES